MKNSIKRAVCLLLTLCLVFTLLPMNSLAASPTITYFNCDVTIQTTKGTTVNLYNNPTDSSRKTYFDQGQTAYSTRGAKLSDGTTWYEIQVIHNGNVVTLWLNAASSGIKIINNVEVTEYFNCDVKIQTTKGTTVDLFSKPTDINRKTYFDQGQTAYSTRGAKLSDGTTWYEFQANYNGNVVTLWLNAASNGMKVIDNKTELSISFSSNSLSLSPGSSETVRINFSGDGIYDLNCALDDIGVCSTSWGDVDYTTGVTYLTVTGKSGGSTKITIQLRDRNGNTLHSKSFNVTVTSQTYTVSYNANGGSGAPSSQTKKYNEALTLSTTEPVRSGYTFKGWSTSANSSSISYQPGNTYYSDKSMTLYAVWEKNPTESSITFSTNSVTLKPGESKTISASFKGEGIAGIYFDEGNQSICTAKWSGSTDWNKGTTAITLTAHAPGETTVSFGLKDEAGNEFFYRNVNVTVTASAYTVSYNANGGSGAPSSQTKTHDKSLTLSSQQPTRSGYQFMGWATSSNSSSITYQPSSTYTGNKDLTLYAVWKKNPTESSITFSTNSVTLKPGESKTISASFKGEGIASIYFGEGNQSICTAKWSGSPDWNKGTTAITLTAHAPGETTVSFGLKDEAGNEFFYRNINVTVTASADSTLKINATAYPKGTLTVGSYYSLQGTVTSNYKITSIKAEILTSSGKSTGNAKTVSPNANSYSFFGSAIDTAMKFNTLSAGTYYLKYTAKDSSGKTVSWQSPNFKVKAASTPVSSSAAVEKATSQMEAWAANDKIGYQWGGWGPEYDCSHAVITAWELAGVKVKSAGATYTGTMKRAFTKCGFVDVTSSVNQVTGAGLQRGDVLLIHHETGDKSQHTAMYCGNGRMVQASWNYDGVKGDSSGKEFWVGPYNRYYNDGTGKWYNWDYVLRYTGG